MNKIAPVRFKFVYEETAESERRVRLAYARIFELARQKMSLDYQSTQEYINSNGDKRRVLDTRGSSPATESQSHYSLSDVPSGENTSDQIWQSVAGEQSVINSASPRKGD